MLPRGASLESSLDSLLQGNPAELLNSSLEQESVVDVYGIVLEAESGDAMEGVTVELVDEETNTTILPTETNSYGYYEFKNVVSKTHVLRVSFDSYLTVERTFTPEGATQTPFTLTKGNGTATPEDFTRSNSGWSLENAVALSTGIALVTILAGVVGISAAYGARRGKKTTEKHNILQDLHSLVVDLLYLDRF